MHKILDAALDLLQGGSEGLDGRGGGLEGLEDIMGGPGDHRREKGSSVAGDIGKSSLQSEERPEKGFDHGGQKQRDKGDRNELN